ncbi:MAG: outer membrane protein transport protein [Bradymonadales bacterium]
MPFRGVLPMGRAGAVVVSLRDPNALSINPALLALGEGHQILVDASWSMLQLEFNRDPRINRNGSKTEFEMVRNEAPGIVIPQVLFSTDFGTDQFALGFGVFPPYAAPARFPADGPQRYAIIDMSGTIAFTTALAFAWRAHERFSIGASIQNISFIFSGVGVASTYIGLYGEQEDPWFDSLISVEAADYFTPSANFGLWARPVDGFELAASFQLFAHTKSKGGRFKAALPEHYIYDMGTIDGKHMELTLNLPWNLHFGLRYYHEDVFDIELDAWFERWSTHRNIVVSPDEVMIRNMPLVNDIKVDNFIIPRHMKDVFGFSLGADWHIMPRFFTLRAGFMYESGAARDEYYSVFSYDAHKFAPSIGMSLTLDFVRLDFAFMHVQQISKKIVNGEHKQYNLPYPEQANVTNNGHYSSFYDFIGLGANFFF